MNNNLREIKLGAPLSIVGGPAPNAELSVQDPSRLQRVILLDGDDGSRCTKSGPLLSAACAVTSFSNSFLNRGDNAALFDALEMHGVVHSDEDVISYDEIYASHIAYFKPIGVTSLCNSYNRSVLSAMPDCYKLDLSLSPDILLVNVIGMMQLMFFTSAGQTRIVCNNSNRRLREIRLGYPSSVNLYSSSIRHVSVLGNSRIAEVIVDADNPGHYAALTSIFYNV